MKIEEKIETSKKNFVRELLQGTTPVMFDTDGIMYHPTQGFMVFEFLKCDERQNVNPWTSDPSRYWPDNKMKFYNLWNITRQLEGKLYLVNYADKGTRFEDMVKVKVVNAMHEDGIYKCENRLITRGDFSAWVRQLSREVGAVSHKKPEDFYLANVRRGENKIKGKYPVKADLSKLNFLEDVMCGEPCGITEIDEIVRRPDKTYTMFMYIRDEDPAHMGLHLDERGADIYNAIRAREKTKGKLYIIGYSENTEQVRLCDVQGLDTDGKIISQNFCTNKDKYGEFLRRVNRESRRSTEKVAEELYSRMSTKQIGDIRFDKGQNKNIAIKQVYDINPDLLRHTQILKVGSRTYLNRVETEIGAI